MYITLFSIILTVGLLLLFLPFKIIKNWANWKWFPIILRLFGGIVCVVSAVSIYTVLAGKIVLPLIK